MNRALSKKCHGYHKSLLGPNLTPLKRSKGSPALVKQNKTTYRNELLDKIWLYASAVPSLTLERFTSRRTGSAEDPVSTETGNSLQDMVMEALPKDETEVASEAARPTPTPTGLLTNLQSIVKDVLPERQELQELHMKKMQTAHQMSDYVSGMVKDYFTSDNLWKIVSANETKTVISSNKLPKFIQRLEKNKNHLSREAIEANLKACLDNIKTTTTKEDLILRLSELVEHLQKYPRSREYAHVLKAEAVLLEIRGRSVSPEIKRLCSEILARIGYIEPLTKSKGIRILSIDGGGMKGLIALEILRELEEKTGVPIHRQFDYMIGVSTGSIIVGLLAFKKVPVSEAIKYYKELGTEVFSQTYIKAVTGIVTSHAYYDTSKYEDILKSFTGDQSMASTASEADGCTTPKVAMVSAVLASSHRSVTPFVFRNYNLPYRTTSNYKGSANYKIWEAVRASSAAPGLFDGFTANNRVYQDGALISNNPSHIGLHEAKQLWPQEKLQCMVSVGMGRYEPVFEDDFEAVEVGEDGHPPAGGGGLSLKDKFAKLVLSATDTEAIHNTLHDLLPYDRYFRFNPYLSETISMDETRSEKLDVMKHDARMYCRQNGRRLDMAAKLVTARPSYLEMSRRWVHRKLSASATSLTPLTSLTSLTASDLSASGDLREVKSSASYHINKREGGHSWSDSMIDFMKNK